MALSFVCVFVPQTNSNAVKNLYETLLGVHGSARSTVISLEPKKISASGKRFSSNF